MAPIALRGPQKCAYVKEELRFDAAVDHRSTDFKQALKTACPNGIDVDLLRRPTTIVVVIWIRDRLTNLISRSILNRNRSGLGKFRVLTSELGLTQT
jgi:hypothetical protein